jgi:hypothetical protein
VAFPAAAQAPTFAWKIKDGDSAIPNRRGKKPCDNEGWPGHWVVFFSGGYAPRVYQIPPGAKDPVTWEQKDAVQPGDYVEVYGNVSGNGSQTQPGIFINHSMVCFRGYGTRIVFGPDAGAVGFGAGALPPGASAVPVGATPGLPAIPGAAAVPGMPAVPGAVPGMPAVPGAAPVMPAVPGLPAAPVAAPVAPPVVVAPSTGYMAAPGAPVVPGMPAVPGAAPVMPTVPGMPAMPPAAPAGPVFTAKWPAGITYAQMQAQGWTDDLLRANGFIV